MAGWALIFLGVYLTMTFLLRSIVQKLRTGSTGFRGISGTPGSTEWLGGVLFVVALALGALAPILDLAGVLDPIGVLDMEVVQAAGGGLFWGGLIGTLLAQLRWVNRGASASTPTSGRGSSPMGPSSTSATRSSWR